MNREEWKARYKKHMQDFIGESDEALLSEQAEEGAITFYDEGDFLDEPESACDVELSYWDDDDNYL